MSDNVNLRAIQNFFASYFNATDGCPPSDNRQLAWRAEKLAHGSQLLLDGYQRLLVDEKAQYERLGHLLPESGWRQERDSFKSLHSTVHKELQALGRDVYRHPGLPAVAPYEHACHNLVKLNELFLRT